MKLLIPFFFVLLVLSCQLPSSQTHDQQEKTMRLTLDSLLKEKAYNGTVILAEKGQVVYEAAHGLRDFRTGDSLRIETPFYLASVAKHITAMTVMMQADRGRLKLDDPLSKFFPDLPYGDSVRIRHMLTHTSGIPDYYDMGKYHLGMTNADVLEALMAQPRLDFVPGAQYAYSNSAYVLLSMITEKASGKSYREFVQQEIFDPLGMSRSAVYDLTRPEIPNRAIGFDSLGKVDDYDAFTTGGGGIFSTITDMLKWEWALYTDQLVSPELLREAYTPMQLNSGELSYYGFGWRIDPERPWVLHSGSLAGFRTFFWRDLETQRMMLLLTNNTNTELEALSGELYARWQR